MKRLAQGRARRLQRPAGALAVTAAAGAGACGLLQAAAGDTDGMLAAI